MNHSSELLNLRGCYRNPWLWSQVGQRCGWPGKPQMRWGQPCGNWPFNLQTLCQLRVVRLRMKWHQKPPAMSVLLWRQHCRGEVTGGGKAPALPSPPPHPQLLPKRIPLDGAVSSRAQACLGSSSVGGSCHKVRILWRYLPSGIKGPRTRFGDEWNIESKLHFNDQRITEQRRPDSIVKVIKDINNISARYQSGEGGSPRGKLPCFPLKPRRFSNSYSWNFLIKPN